MIYVIGDIFQIKLLKITNPDYKGYGITGIAIKLSP